MNVFHVTIRHNDKQERIFYKLIADAMVRDQVWEGNKHLIYVITTGRPRAPKP